MKLFSATVIASNSCYVQILLIADTGIEYAHAAIKEHLKREPRYKSKLKQLPINTCNCCSAQVIEVGFAENESINEGDD